MGKGIPGGVVVVEGVLQLVLFAHLAVHVGHAPLRQLLQGVEALH